MKITAAKVDGFLKAPPKNVRAILLFGPDAGMVREYGGILCKYFSDPDDPFGIEEFTSDVIRKEPARLADTARAMSLMGGSPVVRIRDATDTVMSILEGFLEEGGGIHPIVVEAGELTPKSKIRSLFEKRDDAAAIGCYADEGRDLRSVVAASLSAANVRIDNDAMTALLERLGADRMAVRQEIEKLVLYAGVGEGGSISIQDVEAVIGDGADMSLDDVAMATGSGDLAALQTALTRARAEGLDTTAILRGVLRHFERLLEVSGEIANGASVDSALGKLRPPVFFKVKSNFAAQARKWKPAELARALNVLLETDRQTKVTPDLSWALCERTMLQLAQAARRKR